MPSDFALLSDRSRTAAPRQPAPSALPTTTRDEPAAPRPDVAIGSLIRTASAMVLGALSTAAWAPWSRPLLFVLALGGLYACLLTLRRPVAVGLTVLAFGLVQHGIGHGWIFTALRERAGLPLPFALFASAIFLVYLASFMALAAWIWARFFRVRTEQQAGGLLSAGALAALWTLGEWARGLAFNGFTSLSAGYAWLDTPVAGWLPIWGLYGVGFGVHALCFAAASAFQAMRFGHFRALGRIAAAMPPIIAVGTWGASMPWIERDGEAVGFRLIQTGVRQEDKFDRVRIPAEIGRLGEQITAEPAELILVPETAFPVFVHQLPAGALDRLAEFANRHGASLFVGIARMDDGPEARNGLLQIAPGDARMRIYDKEVLMPFGEYSPWGFDWFTRRLPLPLKDLTPGAATQAPFTVRGQPVGVLICHEDSLPRLARRRAANAAYLLNPSNLAWFEGSIALPQALAMARTRALETGRPILRAANTGVTAHIDHRGKVIDELPPGPFAVLKGSLRPTRGTTPYVRFGDAPALTGCGLALLAAAIRRRRAPAPTRSEGPSDGAAGKREAAPPTAGEANDVPRAPPTSQRGFSASPHKERHG